MKKKNLEKAIILGLILSTGVYGTAWADVSGILLNGGSKVDVFEDLGLEKSDFGIIIDKADDTTMGGDVLQRYSEITVNIDKANSYRRHGIYLSDFNLNAPKTNFTVNLGAEDGTFTESGVSGIYLDNTYGDVTQLAINSYTANIYGPSNNALTISDRVRETPAKVVINDYLKATVSNGNGIVVGASADESMAGKISSLTVHGNTDITISDEEHNNEVVLDSTIKNSGTSTHYLPAKVSYNPAAVYAGDTDNYLYIEELKAEIEYGGETAEIDLPYTGQYGNKTEGKGQINLKGEILITTNGNSNYGIYAGKNGEINLNSDENGKPTNTDLTIVANGIDSIGISAQNGNLIYDGKMTVDIPPSFLMPSGIEGLPIDFELDTSANNYGSVVTMNGENNTITMENGGKALYADARVEDPEAVDAETGEKVEVPNVIIQSGADGIGTLDVKGDIVAANSGKINLTVNKAADITGDIEATNGGTIDFNLAANADMIVSGEDNTLINAGASAKGISLMADEAASSTTGNVQAANGGVINIALGEGAYFAGRVDDYADAGDGNWNNQPHQTLFDSEFAANVESSGTVNMTINGGAWNLTEQSWVTELDGTDATIYLDGDGTGGHALHIGTLTGGTNNFVMNVRPDVSGDMLYVKNGSGTAQNLVINNAKEVLENMKEGDVVRFATVAKPGNGFVSGDIMSPAAQTFGRSTTISDQGLFDVDFDILYTKYGEEVEGDLGTDEAYNGTAFDENKAGTEYIDNTYGGEDAYNVNIKRKSVTERNQSDAAKTIINMSKVNYNNAIYMDRLNKRLGEARYISPEDEQGMWVRIRHDRIGKDDAFRSQNTMYEMGYDVKQDCDNGERRVGMAIDYMDGKAEYTGIAGDGDVKRYGLWLYDTWLGDKGHYTDYVLKWGHLENDFDIMARTTGEKITGDYSNNVFSASAEYGKKNDIGGGWYFEPQAQLQFARVTGADYVTSQDTKVSLDGINSLIGRAGFRLGRDLNENSTVYFKADLLHEFLGDQDITATDITGTLREEYENEGTWYDIGFGFATALGNNSYAFMDFEKSFGNDNDETYQINAGVRWTF